MDWTRFEVDRFVKVMALALSGPSPETQSALRKAAEMLSQAGGDFNSFAEILQLGIAAKKEEASSFPARRKETLPVLEAYKPDPDREPTLSKMMERVAHSEHRNRMLERDNEICKAQLDEAVRYIIKLEDDMARLRMPRIKVRGGTG